MLNKGKDVEEKKNPCVSMWTRRNMISLITLEREWEAIKCYGMILLAIFATKGTSQFGQCTHLKVDRMLWKHVQLLFWIVAILQWQKHWEGRLWEDLAMCPKKTNVDIWELCVTNDKMCKATKDNDDALKQKRSTVVMEGMHEVMQAWEIMASWWWRRSFCMERIQEHWPV